MKITNDRCLSDIQREFNERFPFLKLEFYQVAHKAGEGSLEQSQLESTLTISVARTLHLEGDLEIHENLKVSELESRFAERYGLYVQVFRRSGSLWLQTTHTDFWTLAEQNRKGEHSYLLTVSEDN